MTLDAIHERNARVEADKAWETSWTRRIIITILTYIVIMTYLTMLGMERVYLHAMVPAAGYFLSTLTMPFFKQYWIKNIYRQGS